MLNEKQVGKGSQMNSTFSFNRIPDQYINSGIEEELLWLISEEKRRMGNNGAMPEDMAVNIMPCANASRGSVMYTDYENTFLAEYSIAPDPNGEQGMALVSVGGLTNLFSGLRECHEFPVLPVPNELHFCPLPGYAYA